MLTVNLAHAKAHLSEPFWTRWKPGRRFSSAVMGAGPRVSRPSRRPSVRSRRRSTSLRRSARDAAAQVSIAEVLRELRDENHVGRRKVIYFDTSFLAPLRNRPAARSWRFCEVWRTNSKWSATGRESSSPHWSRGRLGWGNWTRKEWRERTPGLRRSWQSPPPSSRRA